VAAHKLDETNVAAHKRACWRRRGDAEHHVRRLAAAVRQRFVLDLELQTRIAPRSRPVRKEKA